MTTLRQASFSLPSVKLDKFGSPAVQRILISLLGVAFISGAITGYFEATHTNEPLWSDYVVTVLLIILTLCWYHVDSNDRRFARTAWLTMLIFGVGIVGIPTYLICSRAFGKKLIALGWLFIFACVFLGLNFLGEYLVDWLVLRHPV